MERLDELQRATLVDQPWQPLRGAVIAERRMIAATLIDNVSVGNRRSSPHASCPAAPADVAGGGLRNAAPEPAISDPLEQLARGR